MGHKQASERNRRLKKLYDETKNSYGRGVWYDNKKQRYVRYCFGDCKRYFRRLANRKVRRNNDVPSGGNYKKVFDFWWSIL